MSGPPRHLHNIRNIVRRNSSTEPVSILRVRERCRRRILQSQQHVTYFNWRLIRFSLWVFLMGTAFIITACFSLRRTILVPMIFLPLMVPMVILPLKKPKNANERA